MSSGNHLADADDAEYQRRGLCPACKTLLVEIDWCTEYGYECSKRCDKNIPGETCTDAVSRLKCPHCEVIFPME